MLKFHCFPAYALLLLQLFLNDAVQGFTQFTSSRGYCDIEQSPVVIFTFDDAAQQYRLEPEMLIDGNTGGRELQQQQDATKGLTLEESPQLRSEDDGMYYGNAISRSTKAVMLGSDEAITLIPLQETRAGLRGRRRASEYTLLPVTLEMRKCPCAQQQFNTTAFYCPAQVNYCSVKYGSPEPPTCVYEEPINSWVKMMWMPLIVTLVLLGLCLVCTVLGHNFIGFWVSQICCACTPYGKEYTRWAASRIMRRNPGRAAVLIRNAFRREHGIPRNSPPRRLTTQQQMALDERQAEARAQAEEANVPQKVVLKTRIYQKAVSVSGTSSEEEEDEEGMYAACAICFLDLEDGERVGLLETCSHEFHAKCLKVWLAKRNVCPLCLGEGASLWEGPEKPPSSPPQDASSAAQPPQPGSLLTNQEETVGGQDFLLPQPPQLPLLLPSHQDNSTWQDFLQPQPPQVASLSSPSYDDEYETHQPVVNEAQ